jgi:hypothetical protein
MVAPAIVKPAVLAEPKVELVAEIKGGAEIFSEGKESIN